jgi:acetyl esterase
MFSTEDVVYRSVDGVVLSATIYRPAGPGPFPAVIDVHGGAWIYGDRSKNRALSNYLAACGIIVMSVDFRKPPHIYPASVRDVNAGIRWLKRHVEGLGGRPDWVGGLGASSGGHLILLNALLPSAPDYRDATPDPLALEARLRMVVACWPIVDPHARYLMAQERGLAKLTAAHDAYWMPRDGMRIGNPQAILDERRFTDLPPTLIVQGTNDANMSPEMIPRFVRSYREAGGEIRMETYENEPHDFIMAEPTSPASQRAMKHIKDFILSFAN